MFAAEYIDRFTTLSLRNGSLMNTMELRGERIESEGVEHAVTLRHGRLSGPRLDGKEVIVSRCASRK